MPKYYVESGPIQLIFDTPTAAEAAVSAFQWSCDKQVTIEATNPYHHVLIAEQNEWQLQDQIAVSEKGFGRPDAELFDTLDIVAAWQGYAFSGG